MAVAQSLLDVREATGHNDGPEVTYILSRVDMPEGVSWCGGFVYTVLEAAGVQLPGKPATYAWAATWTGRNVIWQNDTRRTRAGVEHMQPARASVTPGPGDVFGIWFTALGRVGHVGLVRDWSNARTVETIEGNTNDALSRDGDGVYAKRRLKSQLYAVSRYTAC